MSITPQDVELLAQLLSRAGVNQIEARFANNCLTELRALVTQEAARQALKENEKEEHDRPSEISGDASPSSPGQRQ